MATSTIASSLFALAVLCFAGTEAGSYCTSYGTFYTTYKYCTYGCCGSSYDRYCCSTSVGVIVGGVIAGIVVLCVIIALICCCIKKQGHAGRVVRPNTQPGTGANVTVVHAGSSGQAHGMQPAGVQPVYGMQPMGAQPQYGMQPMGAQPQYGMQPMGAQPQYGMQPMGAQPQYGMQPMGAQPPMSKTADNPPPAYTYSDPAYPPGAGPGQNQPPPPGFNAEQSSGAAP